MRTPILALLLAPLILLIACADQLVTSPHEALFSTSGEIKYEAILLEGGQGSATVVGDNGIIVGIAGDGISGYPAVRWLASETDISGPEKLGVLPYPLDDAHQQRPNAMNSAGIVVGTAMTNRHIAAWVYSDKVGMRLLPWFLGSTSHSEAHGINDLGIMVGYIVFAERDNGGTITDRLKRGAVWLNTEDVPIVLPPLDGHDFSFAGAINVDGLITGSSRATDDNGFVTEERGVTWLINGEGEVKGPYPLEAGFIPGRVNNAGDIAGARVKPGGGWEAALKRGESAFALPLNTNDEYAAARGIGEVAGGIVRIVGESGGRAALWTINESDAVRGPTELPLPSGSFHRARAGSVNAQGWIVGWSEPRKGGTRPVFWRPVQDGGGDGDCKPHPKTGVCR